MTAPEFEAKLRSIEGRRELLAMAMAIAADESATYLDIERSKAIRQSVTAAHQMYGELEEVEAALARIERATKEAEDVGALPRGSYARLREDA